MKTEIVKLSQIKVNSANPRTITKEKFDKLLNSVLVLPKMLELRPIVVDDTFVALGGNMRYRALVAIDEMTVNELAQRLSGLRDYQKKTEAERQRLVAYWGKWKDAPTAHIIKASNLSEDECKEFIIKDNVGFGTWNMDTLANEWDSQDLDAWGVDVWQDDSNNISPDDCTDDFSLPDGGKGNVETVSFILSSEQATFVKEQLKISQYDDADTFGNTNKNGNALYAIVKQWVDVRK